MKVTDLKQLRTTMNEAIALIQCHAVVQCQIFQENERNISLQVSLDAEW